MDFKLASVLMIICLIVGAVGYAAVAPEEDAKVQIVQLPGEEVLVEVPVEVLTADTSLLLDQAVSDFMDEVEDKKSLRTCDGDKYSLSEISLDEVEEDYSIEIDGEDSVVEFEVELRYKESDLRSCYESYKVTADYEADEDVEISVA